MTSLLKSMPSPTKIREELERMVLKDLLGPVGGALDERPADVAIAHQTFDRRELERERHGVRRRLGVTKIKLPTPLLPGNNKKRVGFYRLVADLAARSLRREPLKVDITDLELGLGQCRRCCEDQRGCRAPEN